MQYYADDDSEYDTHDSASDSSEETIHTVKTLVENQYVGAIIGKKGVNIQRMERKSDATIYVCAGPASDPSDSLITVAGTLDAIENAFSLLTETVFKYSSPVQPIFKLIVHNNQCGQIIGRSGRTIRKIENSTGADLLVSPSEVSYPQARKVIIIGNPESITKCVKEVLEIMITFPAPPISTSGNQVQSSPLSPASGSTSSSGNEHSSTSYSGPSTSSSSNTHLNIAETSTSATLSLQDPSSLDCRAFGEFLASALKKLDPSSQSQLKKDIIASLAKFKKVDDCAICLGEVINKAFSGECLHVFCFECISKWVKVKMTCPMCVRRIKTILHSIKSNDCYEVLDVVDPPVEETREETPTVAFSGYARMVDYM